MQSVNSYADDNTCSSSILPWQRLSTTCSEGKYLGVTISCNLSRDSHVTCIVHKANRMLDLFKRTCPLITDFKVRRTLYLSLIKSQLSYATEVWSPTNVKLRTILQRVLRSATRRILGTLRTHARLQRQRKHHFKIQVRVTCTTLILGLCQCIQLLQCGRAIQ